VLWKLVRGKQSRSDDESGDSGNDLVPAHTGRPANPTHTGGPVNPAHTGRPVNPAHTGRPVNGPLSKSVCCCSCIWDL